MRAFPFPAETLRTDPSGEVLKTFLDEARKPRQERTDEDNATLNVWYPKAAWFVALRRAGREWLL